jgi:hypothetical protein
VCGGNVIGLLARVALVDRGDLDRAAGGVLDLCGQFRYLSLTLAISGALR